MQIKRMMMRSTGERNFKQLPFSPSSSSSSSVSSKYKDSVHLSLGTLDSREDYKTQESGFNIDKKLELMDLSLGNNNENQTLSEAVEIVTVMMAQHAEKYFPLDSSSIKKGLLLNFEDRNGKLWRFRYSYWNSSQSYVITKVGAVLPRPNVLDPSPFAHIQLQNQFNFPQPVRWGRHYSLPQQICMSRNYEPLHRLNYSIYPYNHHHQHQDHQQITVGNVSEYYLTSSSHQIGTLQGGGRGEPMPMVIDSVPVQGNKTAAKRLRLFGVNMDCPNPTQDGSSSSSLQPRQSNNK
ncbi:Detected protein of unknown function [Hibiscus syriacus]|uniref:Uncharacterized protein n=1 Tax=Hibiscus syriacus TaxID=106335 RepID=A0A6A2XN08_HIBSY|nr:Detected protein of unknown function [Hibiscus syriacus]